MNANFDNFIVAHRIAGELWEQTVSLRSSSSNLIGHTAVCLIQQFSAANKQLTAAGTTIKKWFNLVLTGHTTRSLVVVSLLDYR